jgi:ParB-like chromosome segregation protein Spo0J
MPPLEIRILPLERLRPAPYNPRRPLSAKARAKLKASLAEFGLVEPLVWNERTGHVVGGHARLSLLTELGHAAAPVSVVDLDPDREKALNVVLNNWEAQGRYDPDKLRTILEDIGTVAQLTGFDETTLRALRLEPLRDLRPELTDNIVEVMIRIPSDRYAEFGERFDVLVREFDLETHTRRR